MGFYHGRYKARIMGRTHRGPEMIPFAPVPASRTRKLKPFAPVTFCKNSGNGSIKCTSKAREKYALICAVCSHNPDLVDWANLKEGIKRK